MLNVQRMRMLREVALRGTVAAAAETLWVTPSAVSQQLAALEREAGVPLLKRDGRRLQLTEAGRLLVDHTERVLAELEAAQADLAAAASGISGRLWISAFPTAAQSLLIPALAELRRAHPMLQLSVSDLEPEEGIPALKAGQLDVVVIYEWDVLPNIEDPGIEREELLVEPVYLALPKGHPSAGHPVDLRELADEHWIVGRDQTSMLDLVVAAANRAGFEPRTDFHSMDLNVIISAVRAGLGVALVPTLGMVHHYPDVDFQPIAAQALHRRVYAAIRRGSGGNPAIAEAIRALRSASEGVSCRVDIGR